MINKPVVRKAGNLQPGRLLILARGWGLELDGSHYRREDSVLKVSVIIRFFCKRELELYVS
jgi:hypothetical protein